MADTQYRNGRNAMQVADDDSGLKRPESKKSKWERAGMTRDEYERGIRQIMQEKTDASVREARLDRARRGQSNPGN
jgi:hypothetical protein